MRKPTRRMPLLLHAAEAYLFRHAVMRDVAYQLQLPTERAGLHALAFTILEALFGAAPELPEHPMQSGDYERLPCDSAALELALHARAAAENADAESWRGHEARYLWRAARHAAAGHHNLAACQLFEQLAALPGLGNAWRTFALTKAAQAMHDAGDLKQGARLADEALRFVKRDEPDDAEVAAFALCARGKINTLRGLNSQAETDLRQGLELLDYLEKSPAHSTRAKLVGNLAVLQTLAGQHAEAEKGLREVIELARLINDRAMEGVARGGLGNVHYGLGRHEEALAEYELALESARLSGDLRNECIWLANLSNVKLKLELLSEAFDLTEQAMIAARLLGDRRLEALTTVFRGGVLRKADREDEAARCYMTALGFARETADVSVENQCIDRLTEHAIRSGKFEEFRALVEAHLARVRARGEAQSAAYLQALVGIANMTCGRIAEGERQFLEGLAVVKRRPRDTAAEALVEEMNGVRRRMGMPPIGMT